VNTSTRVENLLLGSLMAGWAWVRGHCLVPARGQRMGIFPGKGERTHRPLVI
jgi:hypothetical protein